MFEINWTKIKVGCQSGRKVVTHDSKSDLPLVATELEKRGFHTSRHLQALMGNVSF